MRLVLTMLPDGASLAAEGGCVRPVELCWLMIAWPALPKTLSLVLRGG